MGYSPLTYGSLALVDITPPGAPQLAISRVANREIEARITLPTQDVDGSEISGLTALIVAVMPEQNAGENPFDGVEAGNIATFAENNGGQQSTIFLTDADVGQLKASRFGSLTIGNVYWVACTVQDESTPE